MQPVPEFLRELNKTFTGDIRTDLATRLLYSTDASSYQIEPLGVVLPANLEDLSAAVELAANFKVPILARGAGSSLAGQAIGPAVIIDCSRHLNRIVSINPEEATATVEPGVILTHLNRAAGKYGLSFGPDPASADRATVGGSLGNNATGAHSILYGMAADHLLSTEALLSDGSSATFESIKLEEAKRRALRATGGSGNISVEEAIYRTALDIRENHAETIKENWPRVWRRASGYNLNYLLPWSPGQPQQWANFNYREDLLEAGSPPAPYPPVTPGCINLAPLMAGSEGTLAVFKRLTLRLVKKPKHTVLGVLTFSSVADACDATVEILEHMPTAVELIPGSLVRLARSVPAYSSQLGFVQGDPEALLVVEFAGNDLSYVKEQLHRFKANFRSTNENDLFTAELPEHQQQIWNVRKVGLGLISSRSGDSKPIGFIEDVAVPVEHLGEYVRGLERVFQSHRVEADFYAHASAGCLHIRPLLNLKSARGVKDLRSIAEEAVSLAAPLGAAISGEHGDGIVHSEWITRSFGPEVSELFKELKKSADPYELLNPEKHLNAPPMDKNLRYGPEYQTKAFQTVFDFSSQGSFSGAVEMCNGAGVCRKSDGLMCPSFQSVQDEVNSTRGRANVLRAMISGKFPDRSSGEKAVYEALDLCLACKGCKSECPSAVDMAKIKYEFVNWYYQSHPRRLRDYLFGYIGLLAPLGSLMSGLLNPLFDLGIVRMLNERTMGLSAQRSFPKFASISKVNRLGKMNQSTQPDVLFLTDAFSHYFHPEVETASLKIMEAAGLHVKVLPVIGAGRTLISKGMLQPARKHAERLLDAIRGISPDGAIPVVGAEPSEIYTLRDEFPDFFPGNEYAAALAKKAWMVEEFLLRPDVAGEPLIRRLNGRRAQTNDAQPVVLHGHCYQKAQPPAEDGYPTGVAATVAMLKAMGYPVEVIESGCCGMAGAFGYEAEHYEQSMKVGELSLFPAVREAGQDKVVAAAGTSCRSQIEDGTGRRPVHPVCLVADRV